VNPFVFMRVPSENDALSALRSNPGAKFVAGGTNLLDLMKDAVETPPMLVDINAIPLRSIERRGNTVYIGALARMSDVAANDQVRSAFPVVASALEQSASPQLRNMASIGGNLMQRTRCPYFRDTATRCNKRRPGSGCGAIQGVNRMQAVLGTSGQCIATHASDLAVALVALDAVVHVSGSRGTRDVAIGDFYQLPGDTPQVETALGPDELITAISIPVVAFAQRSLYLKVRDRREYDFPLVSTAVALDLSGGKIRHARIALGGVATIPWRSRRAEGALVGEPANDDTFKRAAGLAMDGARGYGQNDFKIPLAKRAIVRALRDVSQLS
jgi:xanthine dehydrogenase YagS FAD-binding subunit